MISRRPWPRRGGVVWFDCTRITATATKKKNRLRGPPRPGHQVGAAGMPNFCPYPANNAALVTELDPMSMSTVYAPAPTPQAHLVQPSAELCVVPCPTVNWCVKPHSCLPISFFVPVKVTRLRPRISDDSCRHAHPRPFLSRPNLCTPFPHSYIHLPNTILTSPSLDVFHFFSVPKHVVPQVILMAQYATFFCLLYSAIQLRPSLPRPKLYSLLVLFYPRCMSHGSWM